VTYKQGTTTLGTLTYTYDGAGNRLKTGGTFARTNLPPALTSATYNANNQQTAFGTATETYDLNGNLATSTEAGVTTTYTWNVRNQLTGISRTGLTASFTYDSFGRRTGKTINGTTTNFVYDGLNPVQEKDGATVTANLLTGLGIDEFFTRTDGVGARALLPDALGSTIALGDGTGTLQTQYTYEPFGFVSQTGAASTSSYKFTGREDDGTGLYYYRARYYQPRLQRFIAEDPIGFAGGDVNIYAYTGNRVMNLRDPLGLFTIGDYFDSNLTLQGLAAFADGFIPFWDPFAASGFYKRCDPRLAMNSGIGILIRDLELTLALGAGAGYPNGWLWGRGIGGGTKGIFNSNDYVRLGWGWYDPSKGGPGPVFRLALGSGPGHRHPLNLPPSVAGALGYLGAGTAISADLYSNGCSCQ
jgi:RHS repeat-associated protein